MTAADDLLARVIADYDDIETREVYADALAATDEPRAELIALTCALERAGVPTIEALVRSDLAGDALAICAAQHRRRAQLVAAHGSRWLAAIEPGFVTPDSTVATGFVDVVGAPCRNDDDAAAFGRLLDVAPIRTAYLGTFERSFAGLPLAGIRSIDINELHLWPALLAAMPALDAVRITGGTLLGVDALVAAPCRATVRSISFTTRNGARPLAAILRGGFPALDHVYVDCSATVAELGAAPLVLPRSLAFGYQTLTAAAFAALAASDAERWQRLSCEPLDVEPLEAALRAPNLSEIEFRLNPTYRAGDDWLDAFTRASHPLRRIVVPFGDWSSAAITRLVDAHDLVELGLGGQPGIVAAIAASQRASSIRELSLWSSILTPAEIDLLTTSPIFANLRRLALDAVDLTDRGIRQLAARRSATLVELRFSSRMLRIPASICELPALASIDGPTLGTTRDLAAIDDRFGSTRWPRATDIVVLVDHARPKREVLRMLEATEFAIHSYRGRFRLTTHDKSEVTVQVQPGVQAASPSRRPVHIVVSGPDEAARRFVASHIARRWSGEIWDLADDSLVTP